MQHREDNFSNTQENIGGDSADSECSCTFRDDDGNLFSHAFQNTNPKEPSFTQWPRHSQSPRKNAYGEDCVTLNDVIFDTLSSVTFTVTV